jgi:hypothetical protein
MKKQVLVFALGLAVVAALAFLLIRAERTIRRQQTSLLALSARLNHLEHEHAANTNAINSAGSGPMQASQSTFDFALGPDSSVETEMQSLRAKAADLQARLETLEKQKPSPVFAFPGGFGNGNGHDDQSRRIMPVRPSLKLNLAPQEQVPDNWVPFQFNGMTYYKVPLAARD